MAIRSAHTLSQVAVVEQPELHAKIQVPLCLPQQVNLLPLLEPLQQAGLIGLHVGVLGLDANQRPLLLKLGGVYVSHLLVVGIAGSGKTTLLRTLIVSLALTQRVSHLQFALLDISARRVFDGLARLPHLYRPIASGVEAGVQLLEDIAAFAERRLAAGTGEPRLVVVIDMADLLLQSSPQCRERLNWLTQYGRRVGLHLVAAARSAELFVQPPLDEDSFPIKILGRMSSPAAKQLTKFSLPVTQLEIAGDFLLIVPSCPAEVMQFHAAHLANGEVGEVVKNLVQQEKQRRGNK